MKWQDAEVDRITSREHLVEYLKALAGDVDGEKIVPENASSADFIAASARWVDDMDGFFENVLHESVPEQPSWAMIAAIFRAAVCYE